MAGNHKRPYQGNFYRELGRNLRLARVAAGKTQTEVAEYLDVSFPQVQKYESGANRIPVDCLVNLAAYFELPLSQFIAPSDSDSRFQSLASQFTATELNALLQACGTIKAPGRPAFVELVQRIASLWR